MRLLLVYLLFLVTVYLPYSMTIFKRATKDELNRAVNDLENRAKAAEAALKAANKTAEATAIAKELTQIEQLAIDILAAANETVAIKREEDRLAAAEKRLNDEFAKIEGTLSYYITNTTNTTNTTNNTSTTIIANDTNYLAVREELIKAATDLEKRAKAEEDKLKAANKTEQAAAITREAASIQALVKAVSDTPKFNNGSAAFISLENRLAEAEKKLNDELMKIELNINTTSPPYTRHTSGTKYDLIKAATDIEKRAKAAVDLLTKVNQTGLPTAIARTVTEMKQMVKDISAATNETEAIMREEDRLASLERILNDELKKIERTYNITINTNGTISRFTRATKDDLIKAATDLETRAKSCRALSCLR